MDRRRLSFRTAIIAYIIAGAFFALVNDVCSNTNLFPRFCNLISSFTIPILVPKAVPYGS